MISAIVTALVLTLVGISIALALPDRPRQWHGVIGEAYLLGAGTATLLLFALSTLGIAWSVASFSGALAIIAFAFAGLAMRARPFAIIGSRPGLPNLIDVATGIFAAGHLLLATVAPPIENDYLLIWGVKARMFFVERGIDWAFLEAPLNVTSHPDYPLLVPLVYDAHAVVAGAWPETSVGFATSAFGLAALLAVRNLLRDEMPRWMRAIATLLTMPLLFSPYIGIAEGPLIAYATIGILYVRRGVQRNSHAPVVRGAVFLGFAAWTKNEGLSLVVTVAIAILITRKLRLLPALIPALIINVPWLVVHRMHGLRVDLAETGAAERILARISDPLPIISSLLGRTGMPLIFWLGVAVALAISWQKLARDERFFAWTVILQLLVYAGVYFMTPRDLSWHIETSWDRVLRQLLPLVALLALISTSAVIASLPRGTDATDS